jgi:acyl-CoA reductase-like NAD-dependent aldehyde dehydrogenase
VAAAKMRENLEEIARLDVVDNGKPIWEARADMETVIASLEYYGGVGRPKWGRFVNKKTGEKTKITGERQESSENQVTSNSILGPS